MMRAVLAVLLLAALPGAAGAQTSASHKLTESTLNAGGSPRDGAFAASASYRIKLDALGGALIASGLSSSSFHLDAGFVGAYAPPREVLHLRWTDATTLAMGSGEVGRSLRALPGSGERAAGGIRLVLPVGDRRRDLDRRQRSRHRNRALLSCGRPQPLTLSATPGHLRRIRPEGAETILEKALEGLD